MLIGMIIFLLSCFLIQYIRVANVLEKEIRTLKDQNLYLEQRLAYEQAKIKVSSFTIPHGTIEAVKYAMKHAHPDNGGNAEDFIKFKKCYEELTKG